MLHLDSQECPRKTPFQHTVGGVNNSNKYCKIFGKYHSSKIRPSLMQQLVFTIKNNDLQEKASLGT
jgi:hypothetical protein